MMFTVLGASGFIGSALTKYLKNKGADVFSPERNYAPENNKSLGHVIYCIGLTADFRTRPLDTINSHVCLLTRFLSESNYTSFTYLSSARVYAGLQDTNENAVLRADPTDPDHLYNLTKMTGEAACHALAGIKARIVRLSNVVGLDRSSPNFIFSLIRDAVDAHALRMSSAQESEKDYILLEDVVRSIHAISQSAHSGVYNIASGININNAEIVNIIKARTGCAVEWKADAPAIRYPIIKNKLLQREFGIKPRTIRDALPQLIESFKKER